MFETDPGYEGYAKAQIEKAFVGYGEDDKDRSKSQEDDHEAMNVVVVGLKAVQKRHKKG